MYLLGILLEEKKILNDNLIKKLDFKSCEINFINHVPHNLVPKHLLNSDVFVLFSNYENLPCVILESFSCGVPVISTKVGGIHEFFPSNFGFLIEKGDEKALENKIVEIYNNPINKEEEMHEYAIQNFGIDKICDSFTELYKKALV